MSEWAVKLERWLGTDDLTLPGIKLSPLRYSHNAIGGPFRATLEGVGDEVSLCNGLSALGAGVRIYDPIVDQVWWGYIHEASLPLGAVTLTANMDNLRNKIKVLYTTLDPTTGAKSGQLETAWEYDTESILRYGLSELTYSQDGISETEALNLRHTLLLAMKDPHPSISLAADSQMASKITYQCRGWWETLDRRYYKRMYQEYGYRDTGTGLYAFGKVAGGVVKAAQSFQVDATLALKTVWLGVAKVGAPTDNIFVSIYSDSGGSPGTLLGSSDDVASSGLLLGTWIYQTFTFATTISLSISTTYWIVIERDGSTSDTNYYWVDTNVEANYASGATKVHNGTSWSSPSVDVDMVFAVSNGVICDDIDTTALMELIVEEYGTTVDVNTADVIAESGVDVNPTRDGSKTALAEILELLEKGTTNYRRMLARVRPNRRVEIYEEPAATTSGSIDRTGAVFNPYGSAMRKETCPVAIWLSLRGVIPLGSSFGGVSGDTMFFVEESEYDVQAKTLTVRPKDEMGSMNFMVVQNG